MKKDGTTDLRIKRTQTAVKKSFFELIENKGLEHISVKDITDGAMISRNTFYLHYSDKYDLLDKICDELMRTLFFRIGKQVRRVQKQGNLTTQSVASIILLGVNAVEADKDKYYILFKNCPDILTGKLAAVLECFIDLFTDDIGEIDEFSSQYIVSGITGVIKYFATNEVENIEQQCLSFVRLHLDKIIDCANELKSKKYGK